MMKRVVLLLFAVSILIVPATTYAATQAERMAQVSRMFKMTGDEFVNEVLTNCRDGDPGPSAEMRARVSVKDHEFQGRRWYRFSLKDVPPIGKTKMILYLHGGGYVLEGGPAQLAFVEFLMEQTGAEVWYPEYPLAPEHNCMDALKMITELYQLMLKESSAEEITVMGDSAGGGLSVSAAMYFRENELPLPNNLILISPSSNMLFMPRNDQEAAYLEVIKPRDKLISIESFPTILNLWRGDLPIDDYRVDPSKGDLTKLPPMLVFSGGHEVLDLSIRAFVEDCISVDADVQYYRRNFVGHNWLVYDANAIEERSMIVGRLIDPPKPVQ